jgi:putative ABC transport system permease protein
MMFLFRSLNARHLRERKLRTLLTLAGVGAGVALVFSISVINATLLTTFRSSIRDLAGAAEIEVAAADQGGLPASALDAIEGVPGVERAVPTLRQTTRVVGPAGSERILLLGITPEIASLFPGRSSPFGGLDLDGGFGPVGTGMVLARAVADEVGEGTVDVDVPSGTAPVTVTGIAEGGAIGVLNGGKVGIMLLPAAQAAFDRLGRIDSVYVAVDAGSEIRDVQGAIDERLRGAAIVGPPGERGRGLERVFAGLGTLLSLAGTVALFVALFVVYNTMSMSLAERRREMSMAMALGSTRRQLFGAFLFEAFVFGIVASGLGIVGGLALAQVLVERAAEAYRILPVTGAGALAVEWGQVAVAAAGGVGVAMVGAYVPARRLFGVAPIESLRPEAAYEWGPTSALGVSRRAGVIVGAIGIAGAIATFAIYVLIAQERWLASAGLVSGFTGITFLLPYIVPWAVALVRTPTIAIFRTIGRIASDALTKNPGRTTFTTAALVLTLAMAIGVGSALASYEKQVESTADALIGAPIYVASSSFTGLTSDQPLPVDFKSKIEAVPGTGFVYPLRFSFTNVEGEQGIIFAVPAEQALNKGAETSLDSITEDPDVFLEGLGRGEIAISQLTAQNHDLAPGDTLELPTPSGRTSFEIAATYNELVSFDSIYMDYETYARIWHDDKADEFGVLLDGSAPAEVVQRRLDELVDSSGLSARVYEKSELVDRILRIVKGTFSLGRGIQFAALVVAALTIANTMFTAVLERRWEMGLQRAIGMSGSQLGRSVLVEAASIGLIGGVGGALLGTASGLLMTRAMEAQFAWQIAFRPPYALAAGALVGAVTLAAAAGVLPSRAARRSSIIHSLRYE